MKKDLKVIGDSINREAEALKKIAARTSGKASDELGKVRTIIIQEAETLKKIADQTGGQISGEFRKAGDTIVHEVDMVKKDLFKKKDM